MKVITILRMTYLLVQSTTTNSTRVLTCLLLVPVVRYCLGKGEVFLLLINRLLENIKMEHRNHLVIHIYNFFTHT